MPSARTADRSFIGLFNRCRDSDREVNFCGEAFHDLGINDRLGDYFPCFTDIFSFTIGKAGLSNRNTNQSGKKTKK